MHVVRSTKQAGVRSLQTTNKYTHVANVGENNNQYAKQSVWEARQRNKRETGKKRSKKKATRWVAF
jgi:hypothetical protein